MFVGVPLPESVRATISEYIGRWQSRIPSIKYVEPENLHITLKFIGEVGDSRVSAIKERLSDVQTHSFTIDAQGLGAFPNASSPRVIWIGIKDGFRELVDLSKRIDGLLAAEGVPRELKPFHPHITVGRVKRYDPEIARMLSRDAELEFGSFTFERFVLFKSTLTPRGPIYEVLSEYEVGK